MSDSKEVFYASVEKHDRAKQVIEFPDSFGDLSVERKLLAEGLSEDLKDGELVAYIYNGLGGLVLKGEEAVKVKKAVEQRKTYQRGKRKK